MLRLPNCRDARSRRRLRIGSAIFPGFSSLSLRLTAQLGSSLCRAYSMQPPLQVLTHLRFWGDTGTDRDTADLPARLPRLTAHVHPTSSSCLVVQSARKTRQQRNIVKMATNTRVRQSSESQSDLSRSGPRSKLNDTPLTPSTRTHSHPSRIPTPARSQLRSLRSPVVLVTTTDTATQPLTTPPAPVLPLLSPISFLPRLLPPWRPSPSPHVSPSPPSHRPAVPTISLSRCAHPHQPQ